VRLRDGAGIPSSYKRRVNNHGSIDGTVCARALPNKRLKLAARVDCGMNLFQRRSLARCR